MLYGYNGSAGADEVLPRGTAIATGLSSREPLLMLQPTYAPEARVLGGQPSFGLGFGYGRNTTQADLSVSLRGIELTPSETVWGLTDISPFAGLAWTRGVHNWMTYLTGNIPAGSYDSNRLSNIGIGHAAIDAGGGYTYLDQATGREFSRRADKLARNS
jgi:hypothetical protein